MLEVVGLIVMVFWDGELRDVVFLFEYQVHCIRYRQCVFEDLGVRWELLCDLVRVLEVQALIVLHSVGIVVVFSQSNAE